LRAGRSLSLASHLGAHPADEFVHGYAVRCEERSDLVLINRIGQNPQGLIGYLRESVLRSVEAKCRREYCIVTTSSRIRSRHWRGLRPW
jgi:hypothetical protein